MKKMLQSIEIEVNKIFLSFYSIYSSNLAQILTGFKQLQSLSDDLRFVVISSCTPLSTSHGSVR